MEVPLRTSSPGPGRSVALLLCASALAACSSGPSSKPPFHGSALREIEVEGIDRAHVADNVLLAGQPTEGALGQLALEGYTVVIDLRKPDERRGYDEKQAVRRLDLSYHNPAFGGPGELSDGVLAEVRRLLREHASQRVVLHCSSGNRVGAVWLAARVLDQNGSWEASLEEARRVGLRSPGYEERARIHVAHAGNPEWPRLKEKIRHDLPDVTHITVDELAQRLEQDQPPPLLIDAREPAEYAVSHIRGAERARTLEEALELLANEPPDREIVVYCSVGYRSAKLANQLAPRGFTDVKNLEGSIFEWANSEHPVYRGERRVHEVHPYDERWGKLLRRSLRSEP